MRTITICAALFFATSALAGENLADGITSTVVTNGDVWITLETDKAMLVRQAGKEGFIAISNTDDTLKLVQVEERGQTPFSVQLLSPTQQMVTIERYQGENHVVFLDLDGDGIFDKKIVSSKDNKKPKCYRLKTIEWEEIKAENTDTEQAGAGYPPQSVGSPDP